MSLADMTEVLGSLADATRIRILALLGERELGVSELLAVLGGSQSSLSTHLSRLKAARLVLDRKDGTRSFYRLVSGENGAAARAAWEALRQRLAGDARLRADQAKLHSILTRRRQETWADRVAGDLHRQYIPGRTWESVAFCLAGLLELGDVVDLGSGDGALVPLLAPQARSYVCVDASPRMVEAGRKRLAGTGLKHVEFIEADMTAPPLPPGCADTVLLLQSLQYVDDPSRALAAAARLTRKAGRCVVLTLGAHGDEALRAEYGHVHPGFQEQRLSSWLESAGFKRVSIVSSSVEHRSPHLSTLLAIARR
jgi:ArsR family transcriptional regulator